MAGNTVDIVVKVSGVAEAKRQIDELTRAGLAARLAGTAAGGGGGGLMSTIFGGGLTGPAGITLGTLAAPGLVPPAGALLALTSFAAVAIPTFMKITAAQKLLTAAQTAYANATTPAARQAALAAEKQATSALSPAQMKLMTDFTKVQKEWFNVGQQMAPMVLKSVTPILALVKDFMPLLKELSISGGKVLDAFIKPLDALVRSDVFAYFVTAMGKVGVQFAQLFGPILAHVLADVLRLFTALAPAGMALWRALAPLVQTLVYQLGSLLGKLLPPLTRALATLLSAFTPLIPPLTKILIDLLVPLAKIIAANAPLIAKLADVITLQLLKALMPAARAFAALLQAILPITPPLVHLLNQILPPLAKLIGGPSVAAMRLLADTITRYVVPVISGFVTAANNVISFFSHVFVPGLTGFFKRLGPDLAKLGKQAFTDLWNAIKSTASQILGWAEGWVDGLQGILGKIGSFLGLTSSGGGSGSPARGQPAANAALARRMVPAWSSGANWSAWNNVAMAESGWSNTAQNASGAYGIPQALPFTKMPKAAWPPSAGGSADPATQIAWMAFYMKNVYGGPQQAWAFHKVHGWYDKGGWLPPGLSLAYNGTGRPERVVAPGGHDGGHMVIEVRAAGADDAFLRWLRQAIRVRGGNVQQVLGH